MLLEGDSAISIDRMTRLVESWKKGPGGVKGLVRWFTASPKGRGGLHVDGLAARRRQRCAVLELIVRERDQRTDAQGKARQRVW